jgi:hypothetical protein
MVDYRKHRNHVYRTAVTLRKKYHQRHVGKLRDSNPRQWWRSIKNITCQSRTECLFTMANTVCNGDVKLSANNISTFLQSVSNDLQPLSAELIPNIDENVNDDFIIESFAVERKPRNINVSMVLLKENLPRMH